MYERLVAHECAHAASALLLGFEVDEARVERHTLASLEHADLAEPAGEVLIRRDPEQVREMAITVIAGRAEEGDAHWPPRWPMSLAPLSPDEAQLGELVKALELDRAGYGELVADALELCASRDFRRLHVALSHSLEQHGRLDANALRRIKALIEEKDMQHTIKAATATATEQGEFTAIAATYSVDRVKDQIIPGAFARSIERWRASGKRMPLHWNHQGEAANVIGYVDPATMLETGDGLQVSGKLDIDTSDTAREAWRSMKNNSMSLSFGYVTTRQRKRDDGINELHELDLFEISIVPAPANSDTRVIELKSIGDPDLDRIHREYRDQMFTVMSAGDGDLLKVKAMQLARECAPVQITSFEC